jgi:hypothetical protein
VAVTAFWYTNGVKHALSDTNWLSDTIKVALTTSAYTPDQDAHEFFSSVTNELPTANGYTAGGLTLASKTVAADTATNQTRLDAADAVWTAGAGQTLTARRAVIYKSTGVAGTSPVLGWIDFGADVVATSDNLTVQFDPTGVLRVAAS